MACRPFIIVAILTIFFLAMISVVHSISVNYGTLGDNLPPPAQVANFIREKTNIASVKLFDPNPTILSDFANTLIPVLVTIPNIEIPMLVNVEYAVQWINTHIKPYPKTFIDYLLVGNEILMPNVAPELQNNLVPAIQSVRQALNQVGLPNIKVSTAHSMYVIDAYDSPSQAKFRPQFEKSIMEPLLRFHRETQTDIFVNPYPFFSYDENDANFALFHDNKGHYDSGSRKTYYNMFDHMIDGVWTAMAKLGYGDVYITIGETGWPSGGSKPHCNPDNAAAYNQGVIRKYYEMIGTPLMPNTRFRTFLFGLFDENQKSGPPEEKFFGLFKPDFTPSYQTGAFEKPPSIGFVSKDESGFEAKLED